MNRFVACATAVTATLVLGACTVGPDYQRPAPGIEPDWRESDRGDVTLVDAAGLADWWRRFDDPLLTRLVETALARNHDLRAATARIARARAARGAAGGDYRPSAGAQADAESRRISRNEDGLGPIPGIPPVGFDRERSLYRAGFDAAWELDLFGGGRRAVEAATARLDGAVEARRAIRTSVAAEVARQYVELRGAQRQLALTRENLRLQARSHELVGRQVAVGLAAELDERRAAAQVDDTAARLPELEARIESAALALDLLTGHAPGHWGAALAEPATLPAATAAVPAGLRSGLLRRRPDIRRAERELAAATADVGVAVAGLYPDVELTALGAFSASAGAPLIAGDSFNRVLGAAVRWPLFQGGRLRAAVDARRADAREAAVRYEQTILAALREVETGLVTYARQRATSERLASSVAASREAATLASRLYRTGLGDFLDVLEAQRRLTEREAALAEARTATVIRLIALYKTLGGGWPAPPATAVAAGDTGRTGAAP